MRRSQPRDYSEPGYTCPNIDEAIELVRSVSGEEVESGPFRTQVEKLLESIRKNAIALREWGADWRDKARDAESDVERLEGDVSGLEDEVASLKAELMEARSYAHESAA